MANAKIDVVGLGDLPLVTDLYNQIFQPAREQSFLERRLDGRRNPLILVASMDERPIGFALGYELKPGCFYAWLLGVVSELRRSGIGSQLVDAAQGWAKDNDYDYVRLECHNQHRPMLHMSIARGYDIVGIRWDQDRHANLVIFEKALHEEV